MNKTKLFKDLIKYFIFVNLTLLLIFGRSYTGLMLFNFRIGELIIGLSFTLSIFFVLLNLINNKIFNEIQYILIIFSIIVFSFFINLVVRKESILDLYVIRSSSYIWIIGIYLITFLNNKFFKIKFNIEKILPIVLPILYFFTTIHYPVFIINFFNKYSDKFDYSKASDILLIYIFVNIANFINFKSKFKAFSYFLISTSFLLPLFLFMSKGSFFPAAIFTFFIIILKIEIIFKNKLKSVFLVSISLLVFIFSTYEVYGNFTFDKNNYNKYLDEDLLNVETFVTQLNVVADEKNTSLIFGSLYFIDNRLYSLEPMLDWRLQIWQDVIYDNLNRHEFLIGQGFGTVIRSMESHPDRQGYDGLNRNVHNYFINILARGGIVQLMLFILLLYLIYYYSLNKNKKYTLLAMTCIILTSSFDSSMESVRFPFLFYFLTVYILDINKSQKY